jgi:HD-GYP domain-containing protein (c-di-GMP phosphodiesterase class II)
LISRIIAVVETYERLLNKEDLPLNERKPAALEAIKNGAGKRFDPKIAEVFIPMIKNKA